jgi:uncharacterized protein YdhG (YjbR/CyaY superfamily)
MTVDEYLKNVTPDQVAEYKRIGKIVKGLVPNAEESISYGIITWKYKDKFLLYFAAYKTHMAIYPIRLSVLESLKDKLGNFRITDETKKSKATVQFTKDNPVPEVLIKKVVSKRFNDINGGLN